MAIKPRFAELDLLRTLAVLGMILYHALYDLSAFYGWNIDVFNGPWLLLAHAVAITFLLLVGISFAISWDRHTKKHETFAKRYPKYLERGLFVLFCAMLVSLVTFAVDQETYVRFGVLHLIGVSILLLPFFAGLREWNILAALLILLASRALPETASTSLLLPFGIPPMGFRSVDYFPLIPYLAGPLLGYAIGHLLYARDTLRRHLSYSPALRPLLWPGRSALLIYLLHQPVLLLILRLILGPFSF